MPFVCVPDVLLVGSSILARLEKNLFHSLVKTKTKKKYLNFKLMRKKTPTLQEICSPCTCYFFMIYLLLQLLVLHRKNFKKEETSSRLTGSAGASAGGGGGDHAIQTTPFRLFFPYSFPYLLCMASSFAQDTMPLSGFAESPTVSSTAEATRVAYHGASHDSHFLFMPGGGGVSPNKSPSGFAFVPSDQKPPGGPPPPIHLLCPNEEEEEAIDEQLEDTALDTALVLALVVVVVVVVPPVSVFLISCDAPLTHVAARPCLALPRISRSLLLHTHTHSLNHSMNTKALQRLRDGCS